MEQLKAAEFRARSAAQQQLNKESGVTVVTGGQQGAAPAQTAAPALAVGQAPPAPSAAPAPQ